MTEYLRSHFFFLAFLFLGAIVAMAAVALFAVLTAFYRPEAARRMTRRLLAGVGLFFAIGGALMLAFIDTPTAHWLGVLYVILGPMMAVQQIHSRRGWSAGVGGLGLVAIGAWVAFGMPLVGDLTILVRPMQWAGGIIVLCGVFFLIGAWRGWFAPAEKPLLDVALTPLPGVSPRHLGAGGAE
jgi:drug/metabolite transporter (DMT)-like permease